MSETDIEKRLPAQLKQTGQFAIPFGVMALILYVSGFPIFLLVFLGVLTFFIWKVFTAEGRNETRRIFEFYLSANEILRDDDRRWYGFEIQESIARGEGILRSMSAPPPLVYFALGALYQKIGDHSAAVKNLAMVADDTSPHEAAIVFPTKELREYVRVLRKIERLPAEAPLTSSAIRSLERGRKNRGASLLELSRAELAKTTASLPPAEQKMQSVVDLSMDSEADFAADVVEARGEKKHDVKERFISFAEPEPTRPPNGRKRQTPPADRKTISEVLHDIYDINP